jgi:hypothetical protein
VPHAVEPVVPPPGGRAVECRLGEVNVIGTARTGVFMLGLLSVQSTWSVGIVRGSDISTIQANTAHVG